MQLEAESYRANVKHAYFLKACVRYDCVHNSTLMLAKNHRTGLLARVVSSSLSAMLSFGGTSNSSRSLRLPVGVSRGARYGGPLPGAIA